MIKIHVLSLLWLKHGFCRLRHIEPKVSEKFVQAVYNSYDKYG